MEVPQERVASDAVSATHDAGKISQRPYAEKLRDPRWQRRRLEVLEEREWRCESCGRTTDELHVDHGVYVRGWDPWDYPPDLLNVFCAGCHDWAGFYRTHLHAAFARLTPADLYALCKAFDLIACGPVCSGAGRILDWLESRAGALVFVPEVDALGDKHTFMPSVSEWLK